MQKVIYATTLMVCTLFFFKANSQGKKKFFPQTQERLNKKFSPKAQERITKEVRHQILLLPDCGTFDNNSFKLNGYDVILYGQVIEPALKDDAAKVIKKIEGVERVENH